MCNGTESDLMMCPCKYDSNGRETPCSVGHSDCSHAEDAGVRCDGEQPYPLRDQWSLYHTHTHTWKKISNTLWLYRCFLFTAFCLEGDVRLMIDDYYLADLDSDYGNLYIKDELKIGRIEVCVNGAYGTVCFDNELRNSQAASVICWQLGFSRYG